MPCRHRSQCYQARSHPWHQWPHHCTRTSGVSELDSDSLRTGAYLYGNPETPRHVATLLGFVFYVYCTSKVSVNGSPKASGVAEWLSIYSHLLPTWKVQWLSRIVDQDQDWERWSSQPWTSTRARVSGIHQSRLSICNSVLTIIFFKVFLGSHSFCQFHQYFHILACLLLQSVVDLRSTYECRDLTRWQKSWIWRDFILETGANSEK